MNLIDIIPNITDSIPYEYPEIQCPEFDCIIDNFLAGHQSSDHPVFIHMSGIPGSGKSTFYQSREWHDVVCLDFDKVMEALPGYRQDLAALGSAVTFQKWEIPARIIGYELLRRAIIESKNIFFDHGGIDFAHISLMKNVKTYGYSTEMYHISCDFEQAYQRTLRREQITHRHTPRELIERRAKLMDSFLAEYQQVVDVIHFYDTTHNRYELVKTVHREDRKKAA